MPLPGRPPRSPSIRIIELVRRFFLVLLVVLLPLRVWAGDAMSMAMATGGSHAATMTADCGMQMQASIDTGTGAHDVDNVDHGDDPQPPAGDDGCAACALCFAATPLPAVAASFGEATPPSPALAPGPAFRSSDPSRALRPPIS